MIYDPSECCVFHKTKEQWGAFSNMAGGFPIACGGLIWKSSEALYQAARYPDHPVIREAIRDASNGFTCKLVAKANYSLTRLDWDDVRIGVMFAAIYAKIASNPVLWDLLAETGDRPIVEKSHKDQFWGAVDNGTGMLEGENTLGKIWEAIRTQWLPIRKTPLAPPGLLPSNDPFREFQ